MVYHDSMINDELIKAATAKALMESLTDEQKEELIVNAMKVMLTPKKESYSSRPAIAPPAEIFEQELHRNCREIIHKELVENKELQAKIKRCCYHWCDEGSHPGRLNELSVSQDDRNSWHVVLRTTRT